MSTSLTDEGDVVASSGEATAGALDCRNAMAERLRAWRGEGNRVDTLRRAAAARHAERWAVVAELELETVTPVYGGGTRPGEVDVTLPFRPRAVKNGIKHWWWMSNRLRREFADPQSGGSVALYRELVKLWGGVDDGAEGGTAAVRVTLDGIDPNVASERAYAYTPYIRRDGQYRPRPPAGHDADPWHYALFGAAGKLNANAVATNAFEAACPAINHGPAQGLRRLDRSRAATVFETLPGTLLVSGCRFKLRVELSKSLSEHETHARRLMSAIARWICFGGIGARTSRGLGRVQVVGAEPGSFDPWGCVQRAEDGRAFIQEVPGSRVETPIHGRASNGFDSAEQAVLWLLALYRRYRQQRGGQGGRGRSYFPEPDVIRHMTGRVHGHQPLYDQRFSYLPRLTLGAPIIIDIRGHQEPPKATLDFARDDGSGKLEHLDRCPSPLVLTARPQRGRWLPVAASVVPFTRDAAGLFARIDAGGQVYHLRPGQWWPDTRSPGYAQEVTQVMTALRGTARSARGPAMTFLDWVRSGGPVGQP